jgi:hypothetical protein
MKNDIIMLKMDKNLSKEIFSILLEIIEEQINRGEYNKITIIKSVEGREDKCTVE